jgi:glycosyltransferase involved in cell wall biosynthesis
MEPGAFSNIEHVYTGFLPYDEMMKEISKAAFSLASFKSMGREDYKNDLWALPHKFYDSIAAGTPVVVMQSSVSMSKIVEELGIGVVIEPKDVEGSVKKILDAYDNYTTTTINSLIMLKDIRVSLFGMRRKRKSLSNLSLGKKINVIWEVIE